MKRMHESANYKDLLTKMCRAMEGAVEPTFWPTEVMEWWRTESRAAASAKANEERQKQLLESAYRKLSGAEIEAIKASA